MAVYVGNSSSVNCKSYLYSSNWYVCGTITYIALIYSLLILSLQPPPVPSSAAAAAAVSATATDNLSSKAKAESISKASYESETTKIKSGLLAKTKLDKNTGGMGNGIIYTSHTRMHAHTHTHIVTFMVLVVETSHSPIIMHQLQLQRSWPPVNLLLWTASHHQTPLPLLGRL